MSTLAGQQREILDDAAIDPLAEQHLDEGGSPFRKAGEVRATGRIDPSRPFQPTGFGASPDSGADAVH